MFRWLVSLVIVAGAFCPASTAAVAQSVPATKSAGEIQFVPALKELMLTSADPSAAYDISLRNTTDDSITFELSGVDLNDRPEIVSRVLPGSSDIRLTDEYRLLEWLAFEKPVVTLDPGETEAVRVT